MEGEVLAAPAHQPLVLARVVREGLVVAQRREQGNPRARLQPLLELLQLLARPVLRQVPREEDEAQRGVLVQPRVDVPHLRQRLLHVRQRREPERLAHVPVRRRHGQPHRRPRPQGHAPRLHRRVRVRHRNHRQQRARFVHGVQHRVRHRVVHHEQPVRPRIRARGDFRGEHRRLPPQLQRPRRQRPHRREPALHLHRQRVRLRLAHARVPHRAVLAGAHAARRQQRRRQAQRAQCTKSSAHVSPPTAYTSDTRPISAPPACASAATPQRSVTSTRPFRPNEPIIPPPRPRSPPTSPSLRWS
ncbi:hypothetical protein COEX109129_42390 [Corallococcus exiguus]